MSKFFICLTFSAIAFLAADNAHAMGIKVKLTDKTELGSVETVGTCTTNNSVVADVNHKTCRNLGSNPRFDGKLNADLISQIDIANRVGSCDYKRVRLSDNTVVSSFVSKDVSLYTCTLIRVYMLASLKSEKPAVQSNHRIDVVFNTAQ